MRILVTGIIASGKSTFSKFLQNCLGYRLFDADEIARNIRKKGRVKKQLMNAFNIQKEQQILTTLRQIIKNREEREKLNNIMHPLIHAEIEKLCKKHSNLIIDAPIPKSLNIISFFDVIILIRSYKKHILKRMEQLEFDDKTKEELYNVHQLEFNSFQYDFLVNNNK